MSVCVSLWICCLGVKDALESASLLSRPTGWDCPAASRGPQELHQRTGTEEPKDKGQPGGKAGH